MKPGRLLCLILLTGCGAGVNRLDPLATAPTAERLAVADTNSAHVYHAHGVSVLAFEPREAADAFYWASRLDPTWAEPLYARRLALFASNPEQYLRYLTGNRAVLRSAAVQRLDSLYLRALMLNPFLRPTLDMAVYANSLKTLIEEDMRRIDPSAPALGAMEIQQEIQRSLMNAEPETRGWIAFAQGRLQEAVENYQQALADLDDDDESGPGLHAELGRVLFHQGSYDQAKTAFNSAIAGWRALDEEELVRVYESKAMYEHAIGVIEETRQNPDAAREAYARALQEDLGYFPAHIRLGELAFSLGDTMTAVSELALASDIAADDAGTRFFYGRMLANAGQGEDAERELRQAITLEPLFADPYHILGQVLDRQEGRREEAVRAYRDFLARAAMSHGARSAVEARLRALGAGERSQ